MRAVCWISNSILKLENVLSRYVTAWSLNNSDHLAKKARMRYKELGCMGSFKTEFEI